MYIIHYLSGHDVSFYNYIIAFFRIDKIGLSLRLPLPRNARSAAVILAEFQRTHPETRLEGAHEVRERLKTAGKADIRHRHIAVRQHPARRAHPEVDEIALEGLSGRLAE